MTSPKRAEPNEHARKLWRSASAVFLVMEESAADSLSAELIAAAAELERLAARVREWLPIADAPRDGTRVELWYKAESRAVYGRFAAGRWCAECEIYQEIDFTHYRPEPAGPESTPDQETKGER